MAFPSSPTNGQIYIKGSTPYIYSSVNNSWTETTDANLVAGNIKSGVDILGVSGTFNSQLGNIFISAAEQYRAIDYTQGTEVLDTEYCFTVGNYIYTPVFYSNNGYDPQTCVVGMMKISLDSSVLTSLSWSASYTGTAGTNAISSQYLNSGICYFNSSASGKYHYYDTSNDTWTTKQTGSYTTGTQITAPLELNGFKYEKVFQRSNYGTYTFVTIKTQVTKL